MSPKQEPAKTIYQLKVTLQDIDPPIWRRLLVPSNVALAKLHKIIQRAMGWEDSHLHQFLVGKQIYGTADPYGFGRGPKILSERSHTLEQVAFRAKMKLLYEYDFGDSWLHEVLVEKVMPADPEARYPVCLEGARACPPEDCGGTPGYEDLLQAPSDPSHPEHEEIKDWVGDDFDPEALDLDKVNRSLARLRLRRP
ncbi:MAG: plasmid pRiA4b ORF-3 family protein [Pseudomonadota bacterium]